MADLVTTAVALAGGVNPVAAIQEQNTFTFGGVWAPGDTFTVFLTDLAVAAQYSVGYGDTNVAGTIHLPDYVPSYAFTLDDKMYVACGQVLAFSGIGDPTALVDHRVTGGEDADTPGNATILPGNNYGTPEEIKALANYQGKLAIINRNSTQIWKMDADPANNERQQTLENIGTFAPESVRSLGTLDVVLLHDSGFRSLQVRDSSGNAVTLDIGTPIDTLVQALLATLTETEKAGACALVDPLGRYWCFVPGAAGGEGTIYVLSYFPSSQIAAWSTYRPTYNANGVQTLFAPLKFVVKDGLIYARTATGMHAVSGYDACGVLCELPWLSAQNPMTRKSIQSLDAGCQGSWVVSLASDPKTGAYKQVYAKADPDNASSWNGGIIPIQCSASHFRLKMVENGAGYARFASQAVNYEGEGR